MDTNRILLEILNRRGIKGEAEINEFLSRSPKTTYDPFLLSDMEEGVDLILNAVNNEKKICIYGDYDADGITSISILKTILDKLTDKAIYFIPDRFEDGYGLNKNCIQRLKNEGTDLIVTVDCGITAIDEVEFCKSIDMEIIITDHHNVEGCKPDCLVINPKRDDCKYPFKYLAGCGVAFKLFQGIQRRVNLDRNIIREVLDIVAIGTVGDIMPLIDENRTLVKFGLYEINKNRRVGIKKLREKLMANKEMITSQDISFVLVPHLNAAGRIANAGIGVELFLTKDEKRAERIANELIELNKIRKEKQEELYSICREEYHRKYETKKFPIIKLRDAHEGITGIVAGKMKDYAKKPVAIVTEERHTGFIKGTSRSLEGIDIFNVLNDMKYFFEKFGGHKRACGFSMKAENYEDFVREIDKQMDQLSTDAFSEKLEYDLKLPIGEVELQLVKDLEILEPHGEGNPAPIFAFENCIVENITYIGQNDEHAKMSVIDEKNVAVNLKYNDVKMQKNVVNNPIDCIIFNVSADVKKYIESHNKISIMGKCTINRWKNRENMQILVENVDIY